MSGWSKVVRASSRAHRRARRRGASRLELVERARPSDRQLQREANAHRPGCISGGDSTSRGTWRAVATTTFSRTWGAGGAAGQGRRTNRLGPSEEQQGGCSGRRGSQSRRDSAFSANGCTKLDIHLRGRRVTCGGTHNNHRCQQARSGG